MDTIKDIARCWNRKAAITCACVRSSQAWPLVLRDAPAWLGRFDESRHQTVSLLRCTRKDQVASFVLLVWPWFKPRWLISSFLESFGHRKPEEVIGEFAAFPAREHDNLVDSSTQAIIRFRKLDSDEADTPFEPKAGAYY